MVLAQNALVAVPAVVRFVSVAYFWLCVSVLVLLSAAAVFVWRFDGMARILDQAVVWGVGRLCEAGGKVPRATVRVEDVEEVLVSSASAGRASPLRHRSSISSRSSLSSPGKTAIPGNGGSTGEAGRASSRKKPLGGSWKRTARRIVAKDIRLSQGVLNKLDFGPGMRTGGIQVDEVGVWVPSWQQPLKLVVSGVRMCILCVDERGRKLDPHSPAYAREEERNRKREEALRRQALSLIDEILWGVQQEVSNQTSEPGLVRRIFGRLRNSVLHAIARVVMRSVHVELRDVRLMYLQHGEPGPRPSLCKYSGRDAAELRVRSLVLEPKESATDLDERAGPQRAEAGTLSEAIVALHLGLSGISLDLFTYPDTWEMADVSELPGASMPSPTRRSRTTNFSFPKYAKTGTSPERKKMERLKDTAAYAYFELSGDDGCSMTSKLALADEEVHRVVNQWEVSAVLSVLPAGVTRASRPSRSCCRPFADRWEDIGKADEKDGAHGADEEIEDYPDRVLGEPGPSRPAEAELIRTESAAFGLTLDVDIKALMLDVNLSSLGIAQRLKGRLGLVSKYNTHWSARPEVPVESNEILWWHHAGRAALEEVRRLVRWQVPLGRDVNGIEQRRANRLIYEPLYLSKHSRNILFRDPNRRWYQRNTITVADDASMKVLANMEEHLSVEEVGHFRLMAAAKYNHVLASSLNMKEFIATKVDYIISQLTQGTLASRDVLLHLDCVPKPDRAFALDVAVRCPKVSLALDTRLHAAANVDSVAYYACSVKHLHAGWKLGGGMSLSVKSMSMGPADCSSGEIIFVSVASPSLLCHRVCKAADFTRYAVTGHVRADNIASHSVDTAFIEMNVDPVLGVGGVTVDSLGDEGRSVVERIENWKPAGRDIQVSVAAIGAKMSALADEGSDYSRVLLRLVGRYRRSNTYTRSWNRAAEPFHIGTARGPPRRATYSPPSRTYSNSACLSRHQPLRERFASVADLVQDSCSRSLTPTTSLTKLSNNTIRVECPGIAFQVPYAYRYSLSRETALAILETEEMGEETMARTPTAKVNVPKSGFDGSKYMLTMVTQNIRLTSHVDSFARYYRGGAGLIAEGGFMVDLFSYLSDDERNAISEKLAPMKYVFDEESKEFIQEASGVDVLKRKLRHLEIVSMAKVWAYPDDASLIARAARPRTPSFDLPKENDDSVREGPAQEMRLPAVKMLEKSRYPMPIVPYLKTYGALGCVATRVSGEPVVPGDKSLSAGLFIRGIQAWLSPIQLGHLKCLTETLRDKVRLAGDALVDGPEEGEGEDDQSEMMFSSNGTSTPESGAQADGQPVDEAPLEGLGGSSRKLLRAKIHVQQASMVWMIGTWASKGTRRSGTQTFVKKSWAISVERDDPAYIWGQWLAPLYGVSVSGLKLSMRKGDVSGLAVQGGMRAVIARDLQLSDLARHAFVLRPLPARAKRIFDRLGSLRREALGVTGVRKSSRMWKLAIAVALIRQAVNVGDLDDSMTQLPSLDDVDLDSAGFQFKFDYDSGSPGSDERGRLAIDVGQLLAYIRVKQNASLAAFLAQVPLSGMGDSKGTRKKTAGDANKKVSYQSGLKVVVNMVGLDLVGRFQSSDLVSLRLHQGYLSLDQLPVSRYSNPEDIKMHLSARVDNLTVFDLRASEEHQFVLSPSHDAVSCGVMVHMTTQVDGSRHAPHLSVDISNPRIILLFRFVRELLDGISLITSSLEAEPDPAKQGGESGVHKTESSQPESNAALPMQMTINARGIDLVVPTSREKETVLGVAIRDLVLALPGSAMPSSTLDTANMPDMDAIVEESILCSSTFLYGNFTRERAKDQDAAPVDDSDDLGEKEEESIEARGESDEEVSNDTDNRSKPKRRRASRRRTGKVKKADMISGVLLFEDQYDMRAEDNARAGVLQLPEDHSGELDIEEMDDRHDDNILKRSAMFGKPYELLESAIKEVRGQKTETAVPVPAVEIIEEEDNPDDVEGQVEESTEDVVSKPTLAMCISEMRISCGLMVAIPAENLTDAGAALARTATLTTNRRKFILYQVVHEHQLIEPINLAMAIFERNCHTQLHLSLSEFRLVLCNAVYGTVMDFVGGNLGDFSGAADIDIVRFKEIRYNKGMRFGPADSSSVGFRFTLATPEIDCIMSAPPTDWMGDGTEYFSNIKESSTMPFFDVNIANFIMNLATMDSGDTYMNFCSTRIDMCDLRLGYRLHKISSDIAAFEAETMESEFMVDDPDPIGSPSPSKKSTVARKISDHSIRHRDSLKHAESATAARVRADNHVVDIQSQNVGTPLIDFTRNPAVKSIIGEDVACYRLLTTNVTKKDREHVGRIPGSNGNIRFEASVGILEDSTMAIEVALSGALIQYPYFHDMSLINGIVGIFKGDQSSEHLSKDDEASEVAVDISQWMYLNVIITDTEIFVPVVDVDIALKLIDELWQYGPDLRLSEFEKVADVMLATALIHSADSSAILSLEDRGIAVDMALLRFCYAMGGDGEIKMTTDLVNVAALIRDQNARVHTVIQPLSASFDLSMQQPESVERHEHRRMNQAAIKIQRAWRQHFFETRLKSKLSETGLPDDSFDSKGADTSSRESAGQWKLVEKLALDVATPRTRELLEEYYAGKGQVGAMSRSITKAVSVQSVNARLGMFTCRMAFSHVPFWKMATDGIAVLTRQATGGAEEQPVEKEFRPSGVQMSASFERLALVLCNDKPETFGAPDVLNLCLSDGEASLDMASLLPDRPPNAVGHVSVTLFSSFLNSGSSKWEPMLSPWPVRAEFVDANGSGFGSDRKLHAWLTSEIMLDLTFNPASLMSVGDLMSFFNMMKSPEVPMLAYGKGSAVDEMDFTIKSMSTKGAASRAPQKYLIQNQSGLKLYYWTEDPTQSSRKSPVIGLDPEVSDTLKVVPCHKKLTLLNFTASATGTERLGAVINLHFEGNWMPIRDVPINVIGKYKYNMTSPADNTVMPVILDVILVGRTKIITVHSGIWVENSIEIPISFRLHVPTTSLVPPGIIKRKQRLSTEGDVLIGPLKPGEGVYLPLVASLGGLLFLQPADYQEATRDVIRLSIDVADLVNQQGYIVCNSLDLPGVDDQPLNVTMEVNPSKVLSEFQTFKHMEVIGPGTLQRATQPLEVTISIQPTMIFNNAMPYGMNVLLWQIGVSDDRGSTSDFIDIISPRASMRAQPRPDTEGRYFAFHVPPGGEACIYADVRRDILAHVSFEEVNMRTVKWTLCNPSWNAKVDLKERLDRMPASIPLRMLDVGLQLPTEAFGIEQYLERLKLGLSKLRSVHAQLKRNARKAVTAREISRQVANIKTMAKMKSKKKRNKGKRAGNARAAPPQTVKRAAPTSARPIPPQSQSIPASSPPSSIDYATRDSGVQKKKRGLMGRMFGKAAMERTPSRSVEMGQMSQAEPSHDGNILDGDIQEDIEASVEVDVPATSPYQDEASSRGTNTPEYIARRPPPLNIDIQSDSSEDSLDSSSNENRMVAPAILNVSMHSSLAEKEVGSVSRVSFFVPFWLNNRTGVDLFFKDSAASSHPLGFTLPWEYLEVFAPGTSLTDDLDRVQDLQDHRADSGREDHAHDMKNQVVLMNQQEDLALGLAHVSNRKYSQPVVIKTVGNKGTVELKGPMYKAKSAKGRELTHSRRSADDAGSPDEEISPIQVIADGAQPVFDDEQASGTQDALGAMKITASSSTKNLNTEEDPAFVAESRVKLSRFTQRSFEFAVDVSAAPRKSMFRNTKLINLKPKFIVENQTGIAMDVKQFGTADPEDHQEIADEGHRRFSRTLQPGSRAAVYWDDAELPKEIVIRPRLENENPGDWNWSGAFPLPDTEWYFGLRMRHSTSQRRYVNIPVNVTVGSSGSIQVTLKKPSSVPPYRIENLCKEVQLFFVQVPLVYRADGKQYVDCLNPKEVMPYAWDEPTLAPKLRVQAKFSGRQESRVADYALDVLGDAATLLLPTQEEKDDQTAGRLYRSLSTDMPDELKQKLVSLLAAEFSKKVYATVYADGPTRVLRFSDGKNLSSSEHQHVVLDLAFRLKQIEYELRDVNGQFARLGGIQNHHYFSGLDLYGRFKDDFAPDESRARELITKTLRKIPIPESTHQFVKQASRQIFSHSRSQSLEEIEFDPEDVLAGEETPGRHASVRFAEGSLTPVSTSKLSAGPFTAADAGDWASEPSSQEKLPGSFSRQENRDVGHLEGGDSFVPTRSARRRATFHSSENATNINKRQELLKRLIVGDANLLVGGDLNITVVQAQNLSGTQRTTHSFARVRVRDAIPPAEDADRSKQTSVVWQSLDPIWDEQLVFKDVCVASELVVELWDLGGSRPSNHILHPESSEVIKTCRFLGRAEIPLTETLDVPAMTALWYPLMRRTASDEINGRVQLRFHWDVSTRGLMSIKLLAMESVLAQRREILAALQPVQSSEALVWAKPVTFASGAEGESKQVMPTIGQEMFQVRGEESFNRLVFSPSESSIAVLNRHAHDHRQRHLVVTVLEARGLNPRSGVVVALSDNELPNPVVSIKLDGYPAYTTGTLSHTLNPRWPANQRHIFRGVDPAKAELTVTISDQRNGFLRQEITLGRGVVHASNLKGTHPTYIWVPALAVRKKKKRSGTAGIDEHTIPDLQVFLRLQWQRKVDRGSSTKLEMDLAGAGMMVVGGLQDELFNLTLESIKLESMTASHEKTIQGSVDSVQLDNQTLNAGEPVVLAPDAGLRPGIEPRPVVKFVLTQTFGASVDVSNSEEEVYRVEGCAKVSKRIGKAEEKGADIRSYKKFSLCIDPLHLQTDEIFMEQLLSFLSSVPIADVWQDEAWRDQQYRLLTAQFGPREVEALAINTPPTSQNKPRGSSENLLSISYDDNKALFWVREKEGQDMMAMQGQSDLSSWFFIESAEISKIKVNVSIALSSRVLAAGGIGADEDEFSRALGASGYQLVNVSKVEISLGKWLLGSSPSFRGKRTSNGFLSQRALVSNLARHYTREGLKEAHKVLGGSGPAVASVPLAVLWAGGSAVVLVHEAALGKAGPIGVVRQVIYVPIMTVSMFFSGFSRMFAAGMALMPPSRIHGDNETVRRLVRRPTNAIDALTFMPNELIYGFTDAGKGILYDPIAGWHNGNVPGLVFGIFKGVVGLPVRPLIGIFEATSDLTGAIAMASLGREGIVGRTLRRVKAPGAFLEETILSLDADGMDESPFKGLVDAWQRVLLEFFPEMIGEEVQQVMNVRPTRVLLFTTNFVAYLKAKHLLEHSVYRPKWVIPAYEIENVQGDPESRKISIAHVRKFDLKVFGVWPVQMRKGLRCENRSLFDRTVLRLTKVQQAAQTGRPIDDGGKKYRVPKVDELTVLSKPYHRPPRSGKAVTIEEVVTPERR